MAAQSEVVLRQVREDELKPLKERLACHLPHSAPVYSAVSLAAHYGLHTMRPASILVPNSPRPSCFTVISPESSGARQIILMFWSLEEHTAEDVAHHLSHIPDLDWSQPVMLRTLPAILLPSLQSVVSVGGRRVRHQTKFPVHLFNTQSPVLLDTELPPVYYVTRLWGKDTSTIWTHWKFKELESEDNVKDDITHFPCVGIRECGSSLVEPQETLVSWIRTNKEGSMSSTFTLPQHRRRGLASVATVVLARELLQEGLVAYVAIEDDNIASIKFHEGLGFRRQCASVCAVLLPTGDEDQDDLG